MKDYAGCMIQKKNDEIFLHQSDLIEKLEKEFEAELKDVRKVETPAIAGEGIVMAKEDEKLKIVENIQNIDPEWGCYYFWSNTQDQISVMQ